jgi:hypothetical protein
VKYSKPCTENDCANTVASAKPIAPTVRILFSITLKGAYSVMYCTVQLSVKLVQFCTVMLCMALGLFCITVGGGGAASLILQWCCSILLCHVRVFFFCTSYYKSCCSTTNILYYWISYSFCSDFQYMSEPEFYFVLLYICIYIFTLFIYLLYLSLPYFFILCRSDQ